MSPSVTFALKNRKDITHSSRRVARIWKRGGGGGGGLFWKSEKSANNLDPNFHSSWISFTRFVRKLSRNISESSEIQTFFPPKIRWSPKKKFTEIGTYFSAKFENSNVWGGLFFFGGGAIFNFSQKIGLKSTKNVRFCILHKPMGGSSPPAPPLLRYCIHRMLLLHCNLFFCHPTATNANYWMIRTLFMAVTTSCFRGFRTW